MIRSTLVPAIRQTLFRCWPVHFGLETLMGVLDPPVPSEDIVVRKLSGFPLELGFNPNTYQGRFLYHRGMYEEAVIKKLSRMLKPGMTFVDVGANIGLYSIVAGYLVGHAGKVVAVEPQSVLKDVLEDNVRRNRLFNVRVESVALGSANCSGRLFQMSETDDGRATLKLCTSESFVGKPAEVAVRRLDDVLASLSIGTVHGVKVDVEGAELEVLQGFSHLLEAEAPLFILFECHDDLLKRFGTSSRQLVSFLQRFGYRVLSLARGRWRPIERRLGWGKGSFHADCLAISDRGFTSA